MPHCALSCLHVPLCPQLSLCPTMPSAVPMSSPYRLEYFNLRGRAEPVRWILAAAGQPYQDVRFDKEAEWPKRKSGNKWTEWPKRKTGNMGTELPKGTQVKRGPRGQTRKQTNNNDLLENMAVQRSAYTRICVLAFNLSSPHNDCCTYQSHLIRGPSGLRESQVIWGTVLDRYY